MAVEDYPYSFNPLLAVDRTTLVVAKGATVTLHAEPGSAPLQLGDLDGAPIGTTLTTTNDGVIPGHRTTVPQPYINAGAGIMLRESAVELADALQQAASASLAAAAAAATAEEALTLVQGIIDNGGTGGGGGSGPIEGGDYVPREGLYADAGTGAIQRVRLDYSPSPSSQDVLRVEVLGALKQWFNEWGAMRGTSPYSWGDALVRAIRDDNDGLTTTAGNALEIQDRRNGVTGPTGTMWGRSWVDGSLVRRGNKMSDCIVLEVGAPVPSSLPAGTLIFRTSN